MLEKGLKHNSVMRVEEGNTAEFIGSGDMAVLATPAMVALMENAAMLAVALHLGEGETTVGTMVSTSHLKASKVGTMLRHVPSSSMLMAASSSSRLRPTTARHSSARALTHALS